MIWHPHKSRNEARSDAGYRITWAEHRMLGVHYNAWTSDGKHVTAGFNKEEMKQACERHFQRRAAA